MFHIFVDKRERCSFAAGDVFSNEHLTVGDFLVMLETRVILVIERKTWEDLAASIKDGRKENIKKLIDYRNDTGCRVAYIMEGRRAANVGGISSGHLQAHLDHIMWRDNVMVLYSRNKEDTLARIKEVAGNIIQFIPRAETPPIVDHMARAKQSLVVKEEQQVLWEAVQGCGVILARRAAPWTPFDYILGVAAAVTLLDNIVNRVQKEALEKLKNAGPREPAAIKLVAAVRGISLKTSAELLREKGLIQVINEAGSAAKGPLARLKKFSAGLNVNPADNRS